MPVMEFYLPMHWHRKVKGKIRRNTLSLNLVLTKGYRWYQARKKHFCSECDKQLKGTEPGDLTKCTITYYLGCSGKQDLMNVGSIIDKFFQDFLVTRGILKDDNISVVPYVQFIGQKVKPIDTYAKVVVEW